MACAATAYAIRSARYPAFYKRFRTPADARRALEAWKQQAGTQGTGSEALSRVPVMENHTQPRAENGQTVVDDDDQNRASRHNDQANAEFNGSPGSPTSGVGPLPTAPPAAAEHVVGEATVIQNLPPQYMTVSEPSLHETRWGKCLRITWYVPIWAVHYPPGPLGSRCAPETAFCCR
jgi:hypothetical protein